MATPKDVFLTAKYVSHPRNRSQTFRAGYMKDDSNVQYDEAIDITKGLKNRDLTEAKIILNINQQTVVKNSFDVDKNKSFMELFQYFYVNSPEQISQALREVGIEIATEPRDEVVTPVDEVPTVAEVVEVAEPIEPTQV